MHHKVQGNYQKVQELLCCQVAIQIRPSTTTVFRAIGDLTAKFLVTDRDVKLTTAVLTLCRASEVLMFQCGSNHPAHVTQSELDLCALQQRMI